MPLVHEGVGCTGIVSVTCALDGELGSTNSAVKELAHIIMAAAIWGPQWMGLCVFNLIGTLQRLCSCAGNHCTTAKGLGQHASPTCTLFVLFFSVRFKFTLLSAHVQEAKNSIVNLSQQIVIVAKISPQIHQGPVVIPAPLRELVVDKRSD